MVTKFENLLLVRFSMSHMIISRQVIGAKDLDRLGFGGLYGVGKSSEHLPALVILSHLDPKCIGEKSICLVGKGVYSHYFFIIGHHSAKDSAYFFLQELFTTPVGSP